MVVVSLVLLQAKIAIAGVEIANVGV